ncbi:Choline transport protein [Elsinoe australis]|uniref:Choline transport protein n=1 Tax=Elsinoe australis TaxID=40998 RepID=A0A2P7YF16_9PEZI|nr:Choline transport protein [Elsinoe australis]
MSSTSLRTLAQRLRSLHVPGTPLVLTNVYDGATTSIVLSNSATKAIATASYAIAEAQGTADGDLTFEENLAGIKAISRVIANKKSPVPLSADLQDGYSDISATIKTVIGLGVVGANIEDVDHRTGELWSAEVMAKKVREALTAAEEAGVPDFCINARTDALSYGLTIEDVVERGKAYLAAGAVTAFVWGGSGGRGLSSDEVKTLVKELDGRVAVKMNFGPGFLTAKELADLGVARISVGPGLYHKAMAAYRHAVDTAVTSQRFK